jgi:hypothetical protein
MMARMLLTLVLLASPGYLDAQLLTLSSPASMVAGRFGLWLISQYVGNLGWTHTSGDSHYSATATLRNGRLQCNVTARSSEGTFATNGPGLIEITLGLDPDEDDSTSGPGDKMYIIRAACPHPRSSTPNVASWSDEYSTYKQKPGGFDVTVSASGMLVRKVPEQFKGHWEATDAEETRTMTWGLCHKDWACPGISP